MSEVDLGIQRWRDPAWLAEVHGWVATQLDRADVVVTGASDHPRSSPWSTILTFPTDRGTVWFKANAVGMRHEAALYEVLLRRSPQHVLEPVASDPDRGWLLLPDGGSTMRAVEGAATDLPAWERMLREHAELQRELVPYADEVLAAGVPDARPQRLPVIREALLADRAMCRVGAEDGLSEDEYDRLLAGAPAYAEACARLDAYGVPASLQHDDLHDHNVFVPEDRTAPLRVFDWGDAVVGHPFGVLLVSLRVVAHLVKLDHGAPELLRLRDAYLEPWSAEFDRTSLVEAARLASRVGGVTRADCYRRALLEATPAGWAEFGDAVPSWLAEVGKPTPIEP
ncbi:MAG TPA: phosphotransferase [Actinomycetes bacterium]|nr:phosphotransferase [Actinomycetes bacterium]